MVFLWHEVEVVMKFTKMKTAKQLLWHFTGNPKWYRSEHVLRSLSSQGCQKNYLNKMLALKSQGKIVERIVRTKAGQLVRAVFLVAEQNGELKVRLISVVPIGQPNGFTIQGSRFKNKILCLIGKCAKSLVITSERHQFREILSPFFNKFQFFVSQPTRAPSYH